LGNNTGDRTKHESIRTGQMSRRIRTNRFQRLEDGKGNARIEYLSDECGFEAVKQITQAIVLDGMNQRIH
jgi:hypothetical protein